MNVTQEQLEYCNAFQKVLIDLATKFINQPIDQMEDAITAALRQIAEFFGAMTCSINQYTQDYTYYFLRYRWTALSNPRSVPLEYAVPDDELLKTTLLSHKVLAISNVSELPEQSNVAKYLRDYDIKAIIAAPILDHGELMGFVSVSWENPLQFNPQIVEQFGVVGEIFINTLNRIQNEETLGNFIYDLQQRILERMSELHRVNDQLQESESRFRMTLDSLPIPVVVTSDISGVLYMNPIFRSLVGEKASLGDYDIWDFYVDPAQRRALRSLLAEQGYVDGFEVAYRRVDGSAWIGLASVRHFQFAGQPALLAAIVDITELKRTQEAEHQQHIVTEALLDSAMALTSTLELDEVVKHILRNIYLVVPHDVANIMIFEGDEGRVLGTGIHPKDTMDYKLSEARIRYKDDYFGNLIIQTRQPVIVGDITAEPRFQRMGKGTVLRSFMGIPIIFGQEVIGIIALGIEPANFFTETHAKYVQVFGAQAGIAIRNAQLYEQAKIIASMEERQRLARELHDSVTQTLFSANMLAEALPQVMRQDTQKAERYLRDLHHLTRGAMAEMRSLLVELRPESLMQTDLGVLLSQLCDVFTGRTQIEVERKFNRQVILPSDMQLGFYRVAQEALNNAAKYAQAAHVQLDFYVASTIIELRIKDDGQGFDPTQVTGNHFGLKIMAERATHIGAELAILSQIGTGTEVILKRYLS